MMSVAKNTPRASVLAILLSLCAAPAFAERPMAVDDAGTLDRGGAKLEFGWSKDDAVRGFEGAAGFAPIDNVELEVGYGRARDHDAEPDATVRATGVALKWVPLQAETGLSAGLKLEYVRERVTDEPTARVGALAGLATWTFAQGPRMHVNLGRAWVHGDEDLDFWGVGFDVPVTGELDFVVETFGEEHSGPDRQIGLRYTLAEGLKVSGAVGRGNDRNIANVGVAWEF